MNLSKLSKLIPERKGGRQLKRLFLPVGIICVLILTGCQMDRPKTDEDKIAEELDPTRNKQEQHDPEWDKRLGYVNYTSDQFEDDSIDNHNVTFDRNELADTIARIILNQEGIEEIATLVTDKEVLIAYHKDEDLDEKKAASMVKKSAMSILPRFFDVYVTDNTALIPDIRSLHNSTTKDGNLDNTIEHIITEMKKSPQGE